MRHGVLVGKTVLKIGKAMNVGSGSTWPGHVALKIDPSLIRAVVEKNPEVKIILIAGTNGKTTTTKALSYALESSGISVLTNNAGANLLNGLASALVSGIDLNGKLRQETIIFEADENSLPVILSEIPNPNAIVLLNLFRDQLDRYGEVNTTAEKWIKAFKKLTEDTLVIANADDPLVSHVASHAAKKVYFTIPTKYKNTRSLGHAVDSTTCPKCNSTLEYLSISYSHLGNYICPNCSYSNPKAEGLEIPSNLLGIYNQYNLNAAAKVLKNVFEIKEKEILKTLSQVKPAFGRQEEISVNGKKVMYLLSKNPTGFNESLKVAIENKSSSLLILLNDRVPDGHDISWIWDVDFEILKKTNIKIFVSGDRAYDMANRLLFAGVSHEVFDSPDKAYEAALNNTMQEKTLTILPTYSAMLEIRKLISGRAIL
jgi:UDP-N-acetylmuramyl tripeptide synthase